ncbi:MAG: ethanolamine ammonia-lyase subunit EutB, partial [Planctomycetaceae bacterium]|nr:ethanolamine ammonia-lyase subunit EutB [Planctomycetaceae bacterium]
LTAPEERIHAVRDALSSDVIACVVRLMNNDELIQLGANVFNSLPGTQIGARGYLGARVQPNSPTDNVDDIRWQVFDAFSYAVGDVLLGTNPVSSDPLSVARIERTLQDILQTFELTDVLPHCVLAHIDVQAKVEQIDPGSTAFWFQSIAGNDEANNTFDISVQKMVEHARSRTGPYGLYFETGQGADFTNGRGDGIDMVTWESRKYGFARALRNIIAGAQASTGQAAEPWVHLNDVAGFIGPEVFRTKEQLVRCCLEDIAMGKLHGLTIGLDVCSTLHMDVSLDDLAWCIDQIMPANPAYLMALPTRIDPMLGYLTTGYHDHVHVREKFGYKVNDRMWQFFQQIGVIDAAGQPTRHFGDPSWVYLQYCQRRGDRRTAETILAEATDQIAAVRSRGVFIAEGYDQQPAVMDRQLDAHIHAIYEDARESIWTELTPAFISAVPNSVRLKTRSADRTDYILHPESGEHLSDDSVAVLDRIRAKDPEAAHVQIVASDGLNARSLMEDDQLKLLLRGLRSDLTAAGYQVARDVLVVESGRVRAGYRIGEQLFGNQNGDKAILHIIGERPGTGHQTMSVYMTMTDGRSWGTRDLVDHNITRVVSGIAKTALPPAAASAEVVRILKQ